MEATERSWFNFDGSQFEEARFTQVWLLALAAYGVGDIVTTIGLVWFSPVHVEANPIIAAAISLFGGGGFLGLKLLVFYAAIGVSIWGGLSDEDSLLFYGPPLVLAAVGLLTTMLNISLLL